MDEAVATKGTARKESTPSWASKALLDLFEQYGLESVREEAEDFLRRKRVLDLSVTAGRAGAKVQNGQDRPLRVLIGFPLLSDEVWAQVYPKLAGRALYLASLLAARLPEGIEEAFAAADAHLFPHTHTDLRLYCDCGAEGLCMHVGALALRLAEMIETDPFLIFTLRGRGRDETLMHIGRHRAALRDQAQGDSERTAAIPTNKLPQNIISSRSFWSAAAEIFRLSYSIRADELPAAALRRLDPIPLGLPEEEVELHLEEIYAQVARRAQAYGLGFRAAPPTAGSPPESIQ